MAMPGLFGAEIAGHSPSPLVSAVRRIQGPLGP